MGRIKSAWEIALERTNDIVVDKARIQEKEDIESIRRSAGRYLTGDIDIAKLQEQLLDKDRALLRKALSETVMQSLSLPQEKVEDDRYEKLGNLVAIASGNDAGTMDLYSQITGFLKQYPVHREQLISKLKEQFQPMLEQKQEKMRQQYGQSIQLSLETDKEFLQIAKQNLDRLIAQYEDTLKGAKEELKALLS